MNGDILSTLGAALFLLWAVKMGSLAIDTTDPTKTRLRTKWEMFIVFVLPVIIGTMLLMMLITTVKDLVGELLGFLSGL